ncbi:SusC/RagA family TonB-linked outer membrane protein [Daejeonella lutea]|uniref:TonB-linked outer membrane protein, SusC/RagA family n=1 Tax=Daejeonella lutea TaxID=572036 RepID=A0A1T5ESN5_9SPHI|nr:SusC/RagA family TonB-linked outer membrane protein [Daejeonella lutea]SKB86972.1 TonB-linked outer membrane protein, SusC/RagA family [Daejeonella lutea]
MKFNPTGFSGERCRLYYKFLLVMKLTMILLIAGLMQVNAAGYAQKITLAKNDATLVSVLKLIRQQSDYNFVYNLKSLKNAKTVSINIKNVDIEDALKICFDGQPLTYEILLKTVVIKDLERPEVQAADIRVSGKVTDNTGTPLPGVSVKVKDGSAGISTDASGSYSITVPETSTLIFTYIGFATQEVPVNNRTVIDITLKEAAMAINEVVVVTALGLERQKKTLTYSTQSVSVEELTQSRDLNVVNALQGKVAGLNIGSGSSGVGSPSRVILRGNRSINGNSQPLYVIDGVPVRGNPADINPDNIASINVLKGANASALYGSSGQNGVIVIETKKGKQGVNVGLNTTYMAMDAVQSIPFQYSYGQGAGGIYNRASEDAWGPALDGAQVATWSLNPAAAGQTYAFSGQPGVREGLFQRGHNSATNLTVSAGNEKTQTAFNYTYTNADGIVPNNALQRHNIALRITNQISKKFSIDGKLDYARQNIDNQIAEGESSFNPVRHIYTMPPNIRQQDLADYEFINPATGVARQNYWSDGAVTAANPYWAMYRNLKYTKSNRLIAMTALTYRFTDYLKLMVRGSYDGESTGNEEKSYNGTFRDPSGRYALGAGESQQAIGDLLLGFNKQMNPNFSIQANLGAEIRNNSSTSVSSSTGSALNVPNLFAISNTSLPTGANGLSEFETQSVYGNGVFGWKDALFLDISARNDWNSTLPSANRSYFYPAAGVSAVLSELFKLPETLNYLKLRASWTQVGNGAQPYLLQRTARSIAGGSLGYILLDSTLPNTELKPERTTSTELGVELGMLDSRIGLDLTLYKTNTNDQLFRQALPVGSGAAFFFSNGGDVENTGIEAILTTTPVKTTNFNWDLNFNYAVNRNTVKKLSSSLPRLVLGSDSYMREFVLEEGKPFGLIYGKGFARDAQGRVIVAANGLPTFTAGRTVLLGNINPKWVGGLSSSLRFKNLSANFVITHKQGGAVASFTDAILYGAGLVEETVPGRTGGLIFGQNIFSDYTAIKADGTPNSTPVTAEALWRGMGARTAPVGEVFTRSATNTRMREMSITYTLPKTIFKSLPVSSVDLSLVGRNLFFLYRKDSNIDPDFTEGVSTISEGFQSFAPPTTRSYGASLRFNF